MLKKNPKRAPLCFIFYNDFSNLPQISRTVTEAERHTAKLLAEAEWGVSSKNQF